MYGYCLDDPVNLVDPLGLEGWRNWEKWGGMKNPKYLTPDRRHQRVYDTAGEAMEAAYESLESRSQHPGREWAGIVYKADGGGYFTDVLPGERDKVMFSARYPREGIVSSFHTHQPGHELGFSLGDIRTSTFHRLPIYMRNNLGETYGYDPKKDMVSIFEEGSNIETSRPLGDRDYYLGTLRGLLYKKTDVGRWFRDNR